MSFHKLTFIEACEKLFLETDTKFRFSEKDIKTKRDYKYPKREENIYRDTVEDYMSLRKISTKTLDYCDVQQDKNNNVVFHFYDSNDVLLLTKYRPSRKIKDGEIKTWCQKDADTTHLLFNMNRVDSTRPLVITEGEIDLLSVIESGWTNAVSIPLGAGNLNWIEDNFDWIQQFEKIIIWADNDDAGIKMRDAATRRLGEYADCYYVDLPNELEVNGKKQQIKDANEVLYYLGKDKVISLIENATEMSIANIRDLSDVKPLDIEKIEGIKSGLKQLDKWINKFFLGTLTITTGSSGSGKSVWINQVYIAEALNQGYDSFLFTGELSVEQEQYWINLMLAGKSHIQVKNNHYRIISPESQEKIKNWYKGRLFIYDNETDYSAKSILKTMKELVRKKGIKVFVLDNIMTIDLECNHSDIWMKQKEFVVKLVNFARRYNVLVHLVAHPRKLETTRRLTKYDVSGSGDITNLAHYVIGIHRVSDKEKEPPKNNKGDYVKAPILFDCMIDLFKNRLTGVQDKEFGVHFDVDSYRFYTDTTELNKRYGWDDGTIGTDDELPDPINSKLPHILQEG
jgi:twinkle protein